MWKVLLVFGCLFFSSQAAATFDCRETMDRFYSSYVLVKLNTEKATKLSAAKDYDGMAESLDAADDALEYSTHWATL